jgi:hypothetical protein
MGWIREVYELPEGHGWTATPGHKILVLDAGAVVVEFPADWVAAPAAGHVNVRDGATPADSTCQLAVSCLRIPSVDWSGLPLSKLLLDSIEGDDRDRIAIGPVRETCPGGLTLAWTELRVVDPGEHRECRSRMCLARADRVQCLITFDFWPEDEARFAPIWDHVLNSLRLGVRTNDPARGRRIG